MILSRGVLSIIVSYTTVVYVKSNIYFSKQKKYGCYVKASVLLRQRSESVVYLLLNLISTIFALLFAR